MIETNLAANMAVLVLQLGVILFAAWAGGVLFKKFNLPVVVGEIIAGIIIGPYFLGQISVPGFPSGIFPLLENFPVSSELYSIVTVGSIILLFLVGLETDIDMFLSFSFVGSVVGIFGVIFSFILGDLAGVLFSKYAFGVDYGFGHPVPLFLGVISIATSVGISARILSEKRKIDSPEGITILSAAVIDDVLGIIALAVVISIAKTTHIAWKEIYTISLKAVGIWLGFTLLGLVFSRQLSTFLKKFKDRTTISIMSFALALLLAAVFEKSGLAMIIGAYTIGLSLSKTDISFIIQDKLSVLRKFLVPVFFCAMGMLVNVKDIFSHYILIFGLVYVVFAIAGKILGCSLPAWFLNFNLRGALIIGTGMIPRGEVALIIAGIGLSNNIIPQNVFSAAIFMILLTTLFTPGALARLVSSGKPTLKKAQPTRGEHKEISYAMPNPETAELILSKVIATFENEGFYVQRMEIPELFYQIRKNEIFITLKPGQQELVFSCSAQNASFIHTLFYEVIAELEYMMKRIQTLTDKDQIGKKIFSPENGIKKSGANLIQVIGPLAVEVSLKGTTKLGIIEELTAILVRSGQLSQLKQEEVVKDLMEREATMSTGMQDGIALPHSKTEAVNKLISAIGIKKEGADFSALDKKPSNIFIVTVAPKAFSHPYLQYMAEISKFLMDKNNRQKILSCDTNKELYAVLTG